jgi:hypothetical protein
MDTNTENLKNLLGKYQKPTEEPEIQEYKIREHKIEEPEVTQEVTKSPDDKRQLKLKYSPQKVEYFDYNDYLYRREVDNDGNISWEIISGNITNRIVHNIQIKTLEEKIANI